MMKEIGMFIEVFVISFCNSLKNKYRYTEAKESFSIAISIFVCKPECNIKQCLKIYFTITVNVLMKIHNL